jgi:predicted nucleic acid-binding protein
MPAASVVSTDDQSQLRIRREAEAIESILVRIERGVWALISSEALEDEVNRNPSDERRLESEMLLSLATSMIQIGTGVEQRAKQLAALGYGSYDALHLAAAESAGADVLLSTDDSFLNRTARGIGDPLLPVRNPLSWLKEQDL